MGGYNTPDTIGRDRSVKPSFHFHGLDAGRVTILIRGIPVGYPSRVRRHDVPESTVTLSPS